MQEENKENFSMPQVPGTQPSASVSPREEQPSAAKQEPQASQSGEKELRDWYKKQPSTSAAAQPVPKRGKKALFILALVFLLFATILIVPVNYLPGMSGLMGRLGFSVDGTNSVSVGRALWGWVAGGESGLFRAGAGAKAQVAGATRSIFDNNQTPNFQADKSSSGLFDLAALNAQRRAQGKELEGLQGVYYGPEDEEQRRAALTRVPQGWSEEAMEAFAQQNTQEVYFGADENVQMRAAMEREAGNTGSLDSTKLLAGSGLIVGSLPVDWMKVAIAKAAGQKEVNVRQEIDKVMEYDVGLHKFTGVFDESISPASRDLAYAWLLSSAAESARQGMLKKQLGEAGFMAMGVPQKVYDAVGEGQSSMLNIRELNTRFELENKQLLSDQQCSDLSKNFNEQIQDMLKVVNTEITALRKVPAGCDLKKNNEHIDEWIAHLTGGKDAEGLQGNICVKGDKDRGLNSIFQAMGQLCGMENYTLGECKADHLSTWAVALKEECAEYGKTKTAYKNAGNDLNGYLDETQDPPVFVDGAKQKKEKADEYEYKTRMARDKAAEERDRAQGELAAELAKPADQQNPQVIEKLQADITYWSGEFDKYAKEYKEVALPAKKKADDAFVAATKAFEEAKWNFDEEMIKVYGTEGIEKGFEVYGEEVKLQGTLNAKNKEGKAHTREGIWPQMTEKRVAKSFNFKNQGDEEKFGAEDWNTDFFPTLDEGKAIKVIFEKRTK